MQKLVVIFISATICLAPAAAGAGMLDPLAQGGLELLPPPEAVPDLEPETGSLFDDTASILSEGSEAGFFGQALDDTAERYGIDAAGDLGRFDPGGS